MLIQYENELNPAQYQAATSLDGPVLVIAGAGSGKTRTIVYRLARLVESGVSPEAILLLTFTRKASAEMLTRAGELLGSTGPGRVRGGTFHGFAYALLRQHAPLLGFTQGANVMDRHDSEDLLNQAKDRLQLGRGDRKFPKKSTVLSLHSKSRNKEIPLGQLLRQEAYHLGAYEEQLLRLVEEYTRLKKECGLLDYDDLLFLLETLLTEHPQIRAQLTTALSHIMVDEYQDTNLVQGRLVRLLTHPENPRPNVMAVGDDAQSIYAFRGANVRNILQFPETFADTQIIKLERNYRSTQPILELTNAILDNFTQKYTKRLYSELQADSLPERVHPFSDRSQARLVTAKIAELSQSLPLREIAVLFRAGYQSYHVEVELNKAGIPFRKYGGIKFSEAAHIKDVLSFLRISQNPADIPAWQRLLNTLPGIGPKSAQRIYHAVMVNDENYLQGLRQKKPGLDRLFRILDTLRTQAMSPATALTFILEYYLPLLQEQYPDDYPRRETGLEELTQISLSYEDISGFLADLSLDSAEDDEQQGQAVTLSTVHSAKGLEWDAVLVIDLVEDRFPSRHAVNDNDAYEEERRLLYVACTRARSHLLLFSPETIYSRESSAAMPVRVSSFLEDLPTNLTNCSREQYGGGLAMINSTGRAQAQTASFPEGHPPSSIAPSAENQRPVQDTFCQHKIFGRGKVVARVEPNKYKVNFPGFGLKVIIEDYLNLE